MDDNADCIRLAKASETNARPGKKLLFVHGHELLLGCENEDIDKS